LQTPEEFRSLVDALREEQLFAVPATEAIEEVTGSAAGLEHEIAAARDVRLFRARVEEALESTLAALLCDIAAEVLGRELQLAPASIAEIVRRAVQRCHGERPVRVRVHPEDMSSLEAGAIETVEDRDLRRGDAVLEVTGGTIDVTLGVRLDAVLRAYR